MVRSEMWREAQQALYEVNLAGVGAWDEVRKQGADVVESLAASIRLSYSDMTSEIRTQVRVFGRVRLTFSSAIFSLARHQM
jgi:hypothetical protein